MKLGLKALHEKVFDSILKGLSIHILQEHVESFLDDWLKEDIYFPSFSELRRAQHLGYYTVILSNSPNFLVERIAKRFNVSDCQSTEYEVDKDGTLCHISHIMDGEDKAAYVAYLLARLGEDENHVIAFSDSYSDLPLLLRADSAVVVNPDRRLNKVALKFNWPKL